jgi:hypothetical protein
MVPRTPHGKAARMDSQRDEPLFPESRGGTRRPSWPALLLGLIPFIAICFTVGWWDRIYPRVAGVPFNIFWLILWTLLTPLCMWGAYRCERRSEVESRRGRREDQR